MNRAIEGGWPGSLALGDPGDREPRPDHSRVTDVPAASPTTTPVRHHHPLLTALSLKEVKDPRLPLRVSKGRYFRIGDNTLRTLARGRMTAFRSSEGGVYCVQ